MEGFFGRLKDERADVFAAAESESEVIKLISKALLYYNEKRRLAGHNYFALNAFIKRELAAVTAQYCHSP